MGRRLYAFSVGHYLGDGSVWRHALLPAWKDWQGAPAALALLSALAALIVAARRRPRDARVLIAGGSALLLGGLYLVTPEGASGPSGHPLLVGPNSRYLLPALLLGAAAGGTVRAREGRVRTLVVAVALAATLEGLRRGYSLSAGHLVRTALVMAVLAAGAR